MHDIEPYYKWRNKYIASEDRQSPFYGKVYSEFQFTHKIYNYYIHPQWDEFGSSTLYMKLLYVDYKKGYAIIELIGEWNDCLKNDIMFLKRNIIDELVALGIYKYILICEHVLNFHGSDNCYYEEWYEDIADHSGWICFLNTLDHVEMEMKDTQIQYYVNLGAYYADVNWRPQSPKFIFNAIEALVEGDIEEIALP